MEQIDALQTFRWLISTSEPTECLHSMTRSGIGQLHRKCVGANGEKGNQRGSKPK